MKSARFGTIRGLMSSSGIATIKYAKKKDKHGHKLTELAGYDPHKERLLVPEGLSKEAVFDSPILLTKFTKNTKLMYGVIQVGDEFYRFSEERKTFVHRISRIYAQRTGRSRKIRLPVYFLRFEKEESEGVIKDVKEKSIEQRVFSIVSEELERRRLDGISIRLKGKFIVIDGTDGSGKATQTELLVNRLKKEGFDVEVADFPQYGERSAVLVEDYLNGKFGSAKDVGPYRASIFFACDRYVASFKIKEWLEEGKIVTIPELDIRPLIVPNLALFIII